MRRLNFFYVTIQTLTGVAWLFAIYALTPWGDYLDTEVSTFSMAVAVVGSVAAVTKHCARPMDEVYLMGKEAGRQETALEHDARVVRLDQRRLTRAARTEGNSG